jgi:enoyl-CoA hydratase/carnithine racemase
MAGSCASYIMLACDKIIAKENATIFIHNPLIKSAEGNSKSLSKIIGELQRLENIYVGAYAQKTGKDEQTIRLLMDDETTFTAEEAKEIGLVDEVLTLSENFNVKANATKGFYQFVAQYFSQQKQSFEDAKSQEQNQQKGKIEMEIKDAESLIAVLTSLKDLNDVELVKAELDNIIGAVEKLDIKEKKDEAEESPKEEKPTEEKPKEDFQAKLDEAIAQATSNIMEQAEAKINSLLAVVTNPKTETKSHSEVYNAMASGIEKSAYYKAHKHDILLGK